MTWTMYLDDERDPSHTYDEVCRTYQDAVAVVYNRNSLPSFISFDHDLGPESVDGEGNELSGYSFAKWMVEQDLKDIFSLSEDFEFNVHSANPVGAENISNYLDLFLTHKHYIKGRRSHENEIDR